MPDQIITQPQTVLIHCVYFQASGKFYSTGQAAFDVGIFRACFFPREVARLLRNRSQLPGLASGYWNDPFTIDFDTFHNGNHVINGYPELCL